MDSSYASFLNLLTQPASALHTLPDSIIHGAIAHYSHTLPAELLTSFIRALVRSPTLWSNRTWIHLSATHSALRQSTHAVIADLRRTTPSGLIFGPDIIPPLQNWVTFIREAVASTGSTLVQLHAAIAVLGGLSAGLKDSGADLKPSEPKFVHLLHRELVSKCAHAIELHASLASSPWGNEFRALPTGDESMSLLLFFIDVDHLFHGVRP
jgi:hypothetical protein